jgi:hypothetical protein
MYTKIYILTDICIHRVSERAGGQDSPPFSLISALNFEHDTHKSNRDKTCIIATDDKRGSCTTHEDLAGLPSGLAE